jgi:hypothetical protein
LWQIDHRSADVAAIGVNNPQKRRIGTHQRPSPQ